MMSSEIAVTVASVPAQRPKPKDRTSLRPCLLQSEYQIRWHCRQGRGGRQ